MAESFTKVIPDAVEAEDHLYHVVRTNSGGARQLKLQRPSQ